MYLFGIIPNLISNTQEAYADRTQNNDLGFTRTDFMNHLAGVTALQGASFDPTGSGTISYSFGPSFVTMSQSRPSSFSHRNDFTIDYVGTAPDYEIMDCSGTVIDSGSYSGPVNLDTNVFSSYACLQTTAYLHPGTTIDNLMVTWNPLPIFDIVIDGPETITAGQCANYQVSWSLSYINEAQVALYVQLPSDSDGSLTNFNPSYGQFPNNNLGLTGVSSGGIYTDTALTIANTNIPAHSIYWTLSNVSLGTSKIHQFQLCSVLGTQTGVVYNLNGMINGSVANPKNTNTVTTTIISSPKAELKAEVGPSLQISGSVLPVNYSFTVSNGFYNQIATEDIFNPRVELDFTDIFNGIIAQCPHVPNTLSDRQALVTPPTGYTRAANSLVKTLSPILMHPGDAVTENFQVNLSGCLGDDNNPLDVNVKFLGDNITSLEKLLSTKIWAIAQTPVSSSPGGCNFFTTNNQDHLNGGQMENMYASNTDSYPGTLIQKFGTTYAGNNQWNYSDKVRYNVISYTKIPLNLFQPLESEYSLTFRAEEAPIDESQSFISDDGLGGKLFNCQQHMTKATNEFILSTSGTQQVRPIIHAPRTDHVGVDRKQCSFKGTVPEMAQVENSRDTFYFVDSNGAYPSTSNLPPVDTSYFSSTGAYVPSSLGSGWSTTAPSADTGYVWIASYRRCLNSIDNPAPMGSSCYQMPSVDYAVANFKVKDSNACTSGNIGAWGHGGGFKEIIESYHESNTPLNDDSAVLAINPRANPATMTQGCSFEGATILPKQSYIPLGNGTVSWSGSDSYQCNTPAQTYSVKFSVGNESLSNNVVTVDIAPLPDGTGYPTITNISNGGSISGNKILRNFPSLSSGTIIEESFDVLRPSGSFNNNDVVFFNGTLSAAGQCNPVTTSISKRINLICSSVIPSLHTEKFLDKTIVESRGVINYAVTTSNNGDAPTSSTFVLDKIVSNMEFKSIQTSGSIVSMSGLLSTNFDCSNCKVYFSDASDLSIPSPSFRYRVVSHDASTAIFESENGTQPFMIGSNNQGLRTSPFGAYTTMVAVVLDDENGLFPVNHSKTRGMQLQDTSHHRGDIIYNSVATISDELLQNISNMVETTLLPTFDYSISKQIVQEASLLEAGGSIVYQLHVYNNGPISRVIDVIDNLDPHLSFDAMITTGLQASGVIFTGAPSLSGDPQILTWSGVGLDGYQTGILNFRVHIAEGYTGIIRNQAYIPVETGEQIGLNCNQTNYNYSCDGNILTGSESIETPPDTTGSKVCSNDLGKSCQSSLDCDGSYSYGSCQVAVFGTCVTENKLQGNPCTLDSECNTIEGYCSESGDYCESDSHCKEGQVCKVENEYQDGRCDGVEQRCSENEKINCNNDTDCSVTNIGFCIMNEAISGAGTEGDCNNSDEIYACIGEITPHYDLSINKEFLGGNTILGGTGTFMITIHNSGNIDAYDIVVTDLLPTGMTLVSSSSSSFTQVPTTNTWTGDIMSNSSATIELIIAFTATGSMSNIAIVSTGTMTTPETVALTGFNTGTLLYNVNPISGTALSGWATPETNNVDQEIITINSNDPIPFDFVINKQVIEYSSSHVIFALNYEIIGDPNLMYQDIDIIDRSSPYLIFSGIVSSSIGNPNVSTDGSGQILSRTGLTMRGASSGSILVEYTMVTGAYGAIYNTVSIPSHSGEIVGDTGCYLTTLVDPCIDKPADMTYYMTGDEANLLTSPPKDTYSCNNEDVVGICIVQTEVPPQYDLSINKEFLGGNTILGGTGTFMITIHNSGNIDAYDIVVTDLLPTGMTLVSSSSSSFTQVPTTNTWTGDIMSNSSATIELIVAFTATGSMSNIAIVSTGTMTTPETIALTGFNTGTLLYNVNPISGTALSGWATPETNNVDQEIITIGSPLINSIDGIVYRDQNFSSGYNDGEGVFSGVLVNLVNSSGVIIETRMTNLLGYYYFGDLVNGTYSITYDTSTIPGYIPYISNTGTVNNIERGATNGLMAITGVTLMGGENSINNNFGLVTPPTTPIPSLGSIAGSVYVDTGSNSGDLDPNDSLVSNITVVLLENNIPIASTSTDINGAYLFTGLTSGNYSVQYINTTPYNSSVANSGTLISNVISLTQINVILGDAQHSVENDFGLLPNPIVPPILGSLNGYIYVDTGSMSGNLDNEDSLLLGVTVYLLNGNGAIMDSTQTNSNGYYNFPNLEAGNYSVTYLNPNPSVLESSVVNPGDSAEGISFILTQINLGTGQISNNNNFGLVPILTPSTTPMSSLNGYVYHDINVSNLLDGDPILSGVLVMLSNGLYTYTDVNGYYNFPNLISGSYTVSYIVPNTLLSSISNPGDLGSQSITLTNILVNLGDNEISNNNNFGLVTPPTTPIPSLGSIAGSVYVDTGSNSGDLDPNDSLVTNITVVLLENNIPIASTSTDINGAYLFTGLTSGNYSVQYINTTPYNSSVANTGTLVSNVVSLTQINVILGDAQHSVENDFGLLPSSETNIIPLTGSFSGHVWYDPNRNQSQESGEAHASTIVVEIRNSSGVVVLTLVTDAYGWYTGVLPVGTYYTNVIAPNGYQLTTPNNTAFNILANHDQFVDNDGLAQVVIPTITNNVGGSSVGPTVTPLSPTPTTNEGFSIIPSTPIPTIAIKKEVVSLELRDKEDTLFGEVLVSLPNVLPKTGVDGKILYYALLFMFTIGIYVIFPSRKKTKNL